MQNPFGRVLARSAGVLASAVLTTSLISGCGDGASTEQKPGEVPPVLQESNKNMEDFMNSKGKAGKSKPADKAEPPAEAPKP